jgi:enamine deaminase RidA (YjgF/YER057c/UK114 family)
MRKPLGFSKHGGERMVFGKGTIASGTFVFLAGSDGRHPETNICPPTMGEQIDILWDRIRDRLEEAGTSCEDIVQMMVFVTDADEWARQGRWFQDRWLRKHAPKVLEEGRTSTLIEVRRLALPEMQIEVQVIAVIPD